MTGAAELKRRACDGIDRRAAEVIALGERLERTPELGFKEHRTAAMIDDALRGLGCDDVRAGLAVTGVRGALRGRPGPTTVGVLGELDALICHAHPLVDAATGAAHTCGHHAQIATLFGVGIGVAEVIAELTGTVVLFAVPAEEHVDLDYRQQLVRTGAIEFPAGKPELIRLGAFDDIDIAMMIHSASNTPDRRFFIAGGSNGFVSKSVRFRGRSAHAAAAPHHGINALNAAAIAIMAINAQRETFPDDDAIRVHAIVSAGGDAVNVVPDDVRLHMMVRARNLAALEETGFKIDRALRGAALSVGAEVDIDDQPGYLPLLQDPALTRLFRANAETLVGGDNVVVTPHKHGSTDMGDLSHLIPVIHPLGGGYNGLNHTERFGVADPEMAYIVPAKALAMTVIDLLVAGGAGAQELLASFQPALGRADYLAYRRGGASAVHSAVNRLEMR